MSCMGYYCDNGLIGHRFLSGCFIAVHSSGPRACYNVNLSVRSQPYRPFWCSPSLPCIRSGSGDGTHSGRQSGCPSRSTSVSPTTLRRCRCTTRACPTRLLPLRMGRLWEFCIVGLFFPTLMAKLVHAHLTPVNDDGLSVFQLGRRLLGFATTGVLRDATRDHCWESLTVQSTLTVSFTGLHNYLSFVISYYKTFDHVKPKQSHLRLSW